MKYIEAALLISQIIFLSTVAAQENVQFSSGNKQTVFIELFTSQGCSSCPPAERWINSFENNNKLWEEIVPIAFHVDYWDRLGWPDPYANHAYSTRQYRHQQQGHVRSVYTPGILVNGKEWRGWINGKDFPRGNDDAGILSFTATSQKVFINYSKTTNDHVLNVALLGVGIKTDIQRGENRGKVLEQEFVALSHDMYSANKDLWEIDLPKEASENVERYALAIWVSSMDDISPIQATGYWIPSKWIND
ncbi:MAG: DUF1223 domain-containing protein [Gammaproteobacteria bacterium]|nr:DUF1223 domain-containing protein [Gammaproteobacteria bacterium]